MQTSTSPGTVCVAILSLQFFLAVAAGQISVPQFQNGAEAELAASAHRELNPARRLGLLNQWSELYPASSFRQERFNALILTLQTLGKGREMLAVAESMAKDDESGLGEYWIVVLTISLQDSHPKALERGKQAARALLRHSTQTFAASKCPNAVALKDWYRERDRERMLAHRTLGWVALKERDYQLAEQEFTKVLTMRSDDAEVSFWLGTVLMGQKRPELQSQALYHVARSLAVVGGNALLPEAKLLVRPYFKKAYTDLNKSLAGMDVLLEHAKAGPFPGVRRQMVRSVARASR